VHENNATSSENILFFIFHRPTTPSTTPLFTTNARYMSVCQPATGKQTYSGCIITDWVLALAPTGRTKMYIYPCFSKSICNGANFSLATSY